MSRQNVFSTSDLQNVGTSAQMYLLEIDPSLTEMPVESRAIPLNLLVNSTHDHFLVPVVKSKNQEDQVCVYVEPTDEHNDTSMLNFINNQNVRDHTAIENLPIGYNNMDNKVSNIAPISSSSSVIVVAKNKPEITVNVNIENCNTASNITTNDKGSKEKNVKMKGFVNVLDRDVPPRAIAVLPPTLHFRRDCISPRRSLPQRVRFGPVQGLTQTMSFSEAYKLVLNAAKSNLPIFLLRDNDGVKHIDVSDKDKSNWLGLLPLGDQNTANVWLYEEDNNLYGITVKSIGAGTPMALGYSKPYIQDYGIPEGQPVLEIDEDLLEEPRRWWCYECQRSFLTLAQLQRHIDLYHSEGVNAIRRRYRCRYCTRTFIRLFTLKRHMAHHCNKKLEMENSNKPAPVTEPLNTSSKTDDNRLPSDESLQNYTNVLDFSTNLFDTDRMPGLDISGSSRSDVDFNPYAMSFKDNELPVDLDFDKLSNDLEKSQTVLNEQPKDQSQASSESLLISCPYCNQTILREKKRQHLTDCVEKRVECECGRKFPSNEKLAQHIHAEHSTSENQPQTEPEESSTLEYKCDKCQVSFKRRGMLVNHLWRVHGSSAAVPLQRRVRHYPCAACPKLYRTAAKRDSHHAVHHPGVAPGGRYAIEGGRRSVAPAACGACPRQYATRAKLLQHVRQCHPHLAPPPKQTAKAKSAHQTVPA